MRPDAHRLGDLIFRQAFCLGGVLGASAVALRRPPIGRPDFPSGLPPRRGERERRPLRPDAHRLGDLNFRQAFCLGEAKGSVGRCAPTPTDWATRFFVKPSASARCWERRPLRSDTHRLGDLIFRQAFRPGEVLGASAVTPRRPPIGRPDFPSGLPPRRGVGSVGRCAPTPTDWVT